VAGTNHDTAFNNNLTLRCVRRTWWLCLLALPAWAQPAAAPSASAPPVKLDPVAVTGSHLARTEIERALPVTTLAPAEIEIRDATQPADLLTAVPQITGLPANETATLGATARGDNATVALRGLQSADTLLLLDGRRLAPHPISQFEGSVPSLSPNVNQIPGRAIERVEVLRDGASSVYGTDAVAGVVNFVTRRDLLGTELAVRYAQTRHGDGGEYRATLAHGLTFAGGKGRAMLVADYYHRQPLFTRDRSFSADSDMTSRAPAPWNVATSTMFNARSATSEYGVFTTGTVGANGVFSGARPSGVPTTLVGNLGGFAITPTATGAAIATTVPSRAGAGHDYYWNNNAYRVIQPKTARTHVYASGEFDVSERLTAFANASLYRSHSVTYREPDGVSFSTDGAIVVPATNPYNPFGVRFWSPTGTPNADGTPRLTGTPSAVRLDNKRLADLPARTDFVDDAVYRGVIGARGRLAAGWTWEGALLYSTARVTENEQGTTRKSLLVNALNQTDPAVAFNPFTRGFAVQNGALVVTAPYRNPDSVTAGFRSSFVRDGITKLGSADFRLAGKPLPLWGGNDLDVALGSEFRYEAFDDYRPPFAGLNPPASGLDPATNDFLGFSPNPDTHGNRHVAAAYLETVAPLVGRGVVLPLVRSLELSASVRHERYTDFGETTKPKLGAAWRPAASVLVRASYNEGFHAPNLAQLFNGSLIRTQSAIADAYRSTVTNLPSDAAINRRSLASGNRTLKPETSTGRSVGLVVDVPRVKGLSLSVDYWEIRQEDVITAPTANESVASDRDALAAATQAALAVGQAIGAVDLGSGTAGYRGDPGVVRLPVTQADRDAFAAYNATQPASAQRAVVGAIDYLAITYFNRARQFLNGFDFGLNYRLPATALGGFAFDSSWSLLNDFHAYNSAGAPRTELRETNAFAVGGVTPRWRGTTTLSWRRDRWSAGVGFYYIGRYTDEGATTNAATYAALGAPAYIQPVFSRGVTSYRYVVHDTKSYNIFVSYRFAAENRMLRDTTVRLGVNNLFDAEPPLSSDSRGYDPGIHNPLARGQTWSVQVTRKL
jgi:outer membrane receptor protein involved in Fe transport